MDEGKSRGMINSFPDASDTDYDRAIDESRKRIQNCTPCQAVTEIDSLVTRLNMIKGTYHTRPCVEGYCFSLFTPHTARIQRRVDAYKDERRVHEEDCNEYLRKQETEERRKDKQEDRNAQLHIEELRIQSSERIADREIQAAKDGVETHTHERRGVQLRK